MKKTVIIGLIISLCVFSGRILPAEEVSPEVLYIQSEIQSVLSVLSDNVDRFGHLQKMLENTGKDNKSYDEHKNIWMSTILAMNAISSVCEYENDLTTLFMDLKVKRRAHYYDVRIKSLENSMNQIAIMAEQININHKLMPPDLAELQLFDKLKKNMDSSVDLLKKNKELILQLKAREGLQK
jgi:uncharacterized protein YbaP (TraB family)